MLISVCLVGNMSAQEFPATPEECQQWETEYRHWQEQYEQEMAQARDSESFQPAAFQEA